MSVPNQIASSRSQGTHPANCRLPYNAACAARESPVGKETSSQLGSVTQRMAGCKIDSEKPKSAVKTFEWNLDVPDFVPRWMNNNTNAGLGSGPGNSRGPPPCRVMQPLLTSDYSQPDKLSYCILELEGWLNHLYMEPGKFDLIADQLLSIFNNFRLTEPELAAVVDRIVTTATAYPHFGYQAARVCSYLNQHYVFPHGKRGLFRQQLLQRCGVEHRRRLSANNSPETVSRFYNFALFLAELIVHLRVDDMPVDTLMRAMMEVLQELLDCPDDRNVRCAVSALKCCGSLLSSYAPREMQQLFDQKLDKCLQGGASGGSVLSADVMLLLQGLYHCRQAWDRTKLEEMSAQAARCTAEMSANYVLEQDQDHGSAVFYGPDGKPLSAEESAFLAELDQSSGDEDAVISPMNGHVSDDDIIAEAYEEFLKMQRKRN